MVGGLVANVYVFCTLLLIKIMKNNCKKGIGSKEKQFADRCYWYYNGECIRGKDEPCLFRLKTK